MKKYFFFICVMFLLTIFSQMQAQNRYGLFLHGYSSNAQIGWLNSGTPATLKSQGIIDEYVVPTFPAISDQNAVKAKLTESLTSYDPSRQGKWLLIGHSLGGIIARMAEPEMLKPVPALNLPAYNLKGIVTLGTPHQGAPAAYSISTNQAQVQAIADDFFYQVSRGPQWQAQEGWKSFNPIDIASAIAGAIVWSIYGNQIKNAKSSIENYINTASGLGASNLAPNSSFIYNLNYSITSTVPHVSISGVESRPALIRWGSTVNDLGANYFSNEEDAVNKYNDVIGAYNFYTTENKTLMDWFSIWYAFGYDEEFHHYKDGYYAWVSGRDALNGIDDKWASLHNETLSISHTGSYQVWVPCNGYYGPEGYASYQDIEAMFQTIDAYNCQQGIIDGYYKTVYYYWTTYYSDRTDGFIPRERTKWKSYESITDNPAVSYSGGTAQTNVCFDGTGESAGGYNHGELRSLYRNYGGGGESKPMQYGKNWTSWWINR